MLSMDEKRGLKKIFNYRPMVSMCLFFMAGIIFVVGIYSKTTYRIILSCIVAIAFVTTVIIKLILAKEHKVFKVLSIILAFAIASGVSVLAIEIENGKNNYSGEYFIEGRICERTYESSGGYTVVTIDSVNITSLETLSKTSIDGKLRFYLEEADGRAYQFVLGEKVNASMQITKASMFIDGEPNFYMYNKDVKLLGFGSEESVVSTNEIDATIFDKFKTKVKTILDTHMSSEYSELGYTMLFGDKAGLPDEITDSYSASGISHLLAVSGLHVGFVVTLLSAFLNFLKASNKLKFVIITAVVFVYALLCEFTVSVTRALIMTIVMLFSKLRFKEYDGLNSLAFAGLLILLFKPFELYNVGFQMSFGSVCSIILLSPILTETFSKFLHKKFAGSLSVSLSAQVGITSPLMLSFSKMSIYSVVTNIIVIPIASLAFMFLFASVIISLFVPALGVFTYMFEFLMRIVTGISSLTGSINFASVNPVILYLFSFSVIALGLILSDYIFMKKRARIISGLATATTCLILFVCLFI